MEVLGFSIKQTKSTRRCSDLILTLFWAWTSISLKEMSSLSAMMLLSDSGISMEALMTKLLNFQVLSISLFAFPHILPYQSFRVDSNLVSCESLILKRLVSQRLSLNLTRYLYSPLPTRQVVISLWLVPRTEVLHYTTQIDSICQPKWCISNSLLSLYT